MSQHKLFGFTHVDQTADPEYFIRFLDRASAGESFQAYKRQTLDLLQVDKGDRVLEVGCGTGDDVRALADLVGPTGQVVGVDGSQAMIAEARRRHGNSGLPIQFLQGDAHHLDFANDTFTVCRSDRVFMHLEDPRQALREMVRVACPGGRILVYEVDFGTLAVDVADKALARKILGTWCDSVRDGWLGRRIPRFFQEAGLKDIGVLPATLMLAYPVALHLLGQATMDRALSLGTLTSGEAETWLNQLRNAHESDQFFATLTGFMVWGRKP